MTEPENPSRLERPSRWPVVAAIAVVLALCGYGLYAWLQGRPGSAPPPAPAASPPAAEAAPAAPQAGAASPTVSPVEARAALDAALADPRFRPCLEEGELVRRLALVADNLALDASPRKPLACLAPKGAFETRRAGEREVIAPASYRRYDGLADAVAALDVAKVAAAFNALAPAAEGAYRALGYPGGSIRAAAAKALKRIEDGPVVDGEVAVVPGPGATWLFADPALEATGEVEKQLLRMGPRNTRLLQARARALREALAAP